MIGMQALGLLGRPWGYLFLIDFFSICMFWNVRNRFLFYLDLHMVLDLFPFYFVKQEKKEYWSISFLFGCLEIFWTDVFSIWPLGHPWGTHCQPVASFEKNDLHIHLDCFNIFFNDFFSVCCFYIFLSYFVSIWTF